MNLVVRETLVALGLLAGMLIAVEVGSWLGWRKRRRFEAEREGAPQLGMLQNALLVLLGLLVGFSFSGASTRFIERQDYVVKEANAIGTAYLRADALDEPSRTDLRAVLAQYAQQLTALHNAYSTDHDALLRDLESTQERMWKIATDGVRAKPSVILAIYPPVNEVIDLHGERSAADRRHLPAMVLVLLIMSAIVTLGAVGYSDGLLGVRHRVLTTVMAILVGVFIWTTIDLDHPRRGVIRIDTSPLAALKLTAPAPPR